MFKKYRNEVVCRDNNIVKWNSEITIIKGKKQHKLKQNFTENSIRVRKKTEKLIKSRKPEKKIKNTKPWKKPD